MQASLPAANPAALAGARQDNQLLDAACMSKAAFSQLGMVRLDLEQNELLYVPRDRTGQVYFPVNAVLSAHCVLADGATMEIACIGNEGVLGAPPYTDALLSRSVLVSGAGAAWCVRGDALRGLAAGPLRFALERNAKTLFSQLMQNVACSVHHTIEQRMAKWLLLYMHRAGTLQVPITHEALANILGVRRESVSLVSKRMEQRGMISHVRSQFFIHSTAMLAAQACECYRTLQADIAAQSKDLAMLRQSAELAATSHVAHTRQPTERRRLTPLRSGEGSAHQAERRLTGAAAGRCATNPDTAG